MAGKYIRYIYMSNIDIQLYGYRYYTSWKPADVQTSVHLFMTSRLNEFSPYLTSLEIFTK